MRFGEWCLVRPDGSTLTITNTMSVLQPRHSMALQAGDKSYTLLHKRHVTCCALSNAGLLFAIGQRDGPARVQNAETGYIVHEFSHYSDVVECGFSARDVFLVTVARDARVYHVDGMQLMHRVEDCRSLVFAPVLPASYVLLAGIGSRRGDHVVYHLMIRRQMASCSFMHGHTGRVNQVVVAHDAGEIASVSDDMTVRIWHAAYALQQHVLRGHTGPVTCCAYMPGCTPGCTPAARVLVTLAADATARTWSDGLCTRTIALSGSASSCVFSADGLLLAVSLQATRAGAVQADQADRADGSADTDDDVEAGEPVLDTPCATRNLVMCTRAWRPICAVWSRSRLALLNNTVLRTDGRGVHATVVRSPYLVWMLLLLAAHRRQRQRLPPEIWHRSVWGWTV